MCAGLARSHSRFPKNPVTFPVLSALQTTYKKCNYFHYIDKQTNNNKNVHPSKRQQMPKKKKYKKKTTKNMALAFPIQCALVLAGFCLFLTLTSLINVNDVDWHKKATFCNYN